MTARTVAPWEPSQSGPVRRGLLTADDLAERWQVPRSQVYRLTRESRLPAVRLGKYYRYRLEAIEEFEARGGTADFTGTDVHGSN